MFLLLQHLGTRLIVFVLIFYFIGAILPKTKKIKWGAQKKFKKGGTGRFAIESVF